MARLVVAFVALVVAALLFPTAAGAQQAPAPSATPAPPPPFRFTKLADDVYVASSGEYNSIVILTDEGVVVGDPIGGGPNPNAPQLIKNAIAGVTDKPVRYLVISHFSPDHSAGGAVFADTADIVAQRNAIEKFRAANDPRSPVPNVVVDDKMSIDLGGKHLEIYVPGGRNHSDNMIVLYYPARKILFAVDYVPIKRLPFRTLAGDYPDEWVRTLTWTEQNLDFNVLVPGHGALGSKDNVRQVREYWNDLFTAIRGARLLGDADASAFMNDYVRRELAPKYSTWENFDAWLPENIGGVTKYWVANKLS